MTTRQHAIGDRVRTLITVLDLRSTDDNAEIPCIPLGSLGTVDSAALDGGDYEVVFDADPNRAPMSMPADRIEAAGGAR